MQHDIIAHTPITLDNGKVLDAYIHKQPSGMYALHVNYIFEAQQFNPNKADCLSSVAQATPRLVQVHPLPAFIHTTANA